MMKRTIRIGMIGFGTVASGAYQIITQQREEIRNRLGCFLDVVKIADTHWATRRSISPPKRILTTEAQEILDDPSIDIVVELIGGIHPARAYILGAIEKRKHVVTANKALLAVHGTALFGAAVRAGVDIGFEGSVCGGIPIVRMIKEGLTAAKIDSIFGIVNGTCNYILTKMTDEKKPFAEVLSEAQKLGYAEADPTLDITGTDSAHKLAIMTRLTFGTPVALKEIYTEGIDGINPIDIALAEEFGCRIKLLAIAKLSGGEIEVRVHPTMIPLNVLLSKVDDVYNAVYVTGETVGPLLFYGRGAGSLPTGSAVVSDLIDIGRNILKGVSGRVPPASFYPEHQRRLPIKKMETIESLYYLRFMAADRPGVLSKVSGVLGKYKISISSVIQQGRKVGGRVPLVMMTHRAQEKNVREALAKIDRMAEVSKPTVLIRVEMGAP